MTNSVVVYESFDDIQRAALALEASGYFNDVKSKAQAIVKVMAGAELGLPPFASMSGIHIIQGKPALGANVLATLIKNDQRYNYRVTELSNTVCKIQFYEDGQKCGVSEFTAADAQKANTKNMAKFPKNMLFARAISNGAKWFAPGIFGGAPVYTPEELGAEVDGEGEIIAGSAEWVEKVRTVQSEESEHYTDPSDLEDDDLEDELTTNGNGGKYHTRPYSPGTLRDAMQHKTKDDDGVKASDKQGQYAAACLSVITLDDKERYDLTEFLFGVRSTKELTKAQASAIIDWVEYKKVDDEWVFNEDARQEAAQILRQVAIDSGQQEMKLEGKGKK